jgi:peptide/nickel transport system substrate-binding protein
MSENYWQRFTTTRIARRRALAATGSAALGAAFIAACGGDNDSAGDSGDSSGLVATPQDTTKQAKKGGVLPYPSREPNSLDPSLAIVALEDTQRNVYSRLLYEKPGHLQPGQFEYDGELAESWEWSGDRLQMTLKLRPDVKFHNKQPVNGRTLDVNDVLFSWERFARVGADRSAIANSANPDAPVLSVTAPDSRTIAIKLKYPVSYLTSILGQWITGHITIFPKEADSGFEPRHDMIGTGPYMLERYTPSQGFALRRHENYYEKEFPFIDLIEMPVIPEYAAGLSQFKAGNLFHYNVRSEDILIVKRETPELNLYQSDILASSTKTIFGWHPAGRSPFNDERVRQALSMSYDRDLWIDTFYNVSRYASEGLPVETRWSSHLGAQFDGWWLDPQGKEFGPNAKYFNHDIAEAKRLLAAAGFPNGLEVVSHVNQTGYGADHPKQVEVLDQMAVEAGFKPTIDSVVNYQGDFAPKYRDSQGNFEGWSFKIGAPFANDAAANLAFEYYSKTGVNFFGFDANGRGDNSGDPQVDAMIVRAQQEIDEEKRKVIVNDLQRYLAKTMYGIRWPGGATGFQLVWPAVRNFGVYRGGFRYFYTSAWIDETLPPLKRA